MNNKYYHLSNSNKSLSLTPRIPENYFTKNGYEENKTPRVCFSNSIDGCLAAMSCNLKGKKMYIHVPLGYNGAIKENSFVQNKVPDAKITGEVWFLDKVRTKVIGEVIVGEAKNKAEIFYYGKHKGELYFWNYKIKWYNKLNENLINESMILKEFIYDTKLLVKPLERNINKSELTHSLYIVLTNTKTFMGKIIKDVTRAEYNHASIGLDKTFNHVYGFGRNTDEDESGFILEKMDGGIYRDNNADFCQLELKVTAQEYNSVKKLISEFERYKTKFSFNKLGLFFSALNIPYNRKFEFFCSQFIAFIFEKSNIRLFDKNYGLVRPNDFMLHPNIKVIKRGKVINKAKRDRRYL